MLEIKTSLIIKVPIKKVWDQLINFKTYPQWNAFMPRIEGVQSVGERLVVDIVPPGGKKATFKPILTKCSENAEMRWVGVLGSRFLFRGEHYFILEEIDEKTTRFIQAEVFTGILVPLFAALAAKKTRDGFSLMNECLSKELQT